MVKARVGWAWHGKPRESHEDYTIMASGGSTFTDRDLLHILSRFSLGNPPAASGSPGSLPWVAISEVGDGEVRYLGLTIQNWSSDPDGASRSILDSRYYMVPYGTVCEEAVSYQDLYAALDHAVLPEPGTALYAEVAATDAAEQAESIAELGFDRVATAAAMVLEGSVTVTRCPEPMERRLAFLDAVAALLPYGSRMTYSAGTWHEGGSKYVKLAFSRHNRPDSYELDWHAPAAPPFAAGAYLRRLRELSGKQGGLARIVRHLRTMTRPVSSPEQAVMMLSELDWHERVLEAARRGEAARQDLRSLFDSGKWRLLDAYDDRLTVFTELIGCADVEDLAVITGLWNELAIRGREPFDRLVSVGRAALRGPDPDRGAAYLSAAEKLGVGDAYAAAVIERHGDEPDPRCLAITAAHVKRWLDADRPRTFNALVHDLPLVFALITEFLDQEEELAALLARLKERLPAQIRPFDAILTEPTRRLKDHEIDRLAAYGTNCLYDYLRVAAVYKRLGLVIPAFATWLAGQERVDTTYWCNRLAGLEQAGPVEQGMIDALLLSLGGRTRYLRTAAQGYTQGFMDVVRLARPHALDRLLGGLTEQLRDWRWAAECGTAAMVLDLAAAVSADGGPACVPLLCAVAAERAVARDLGDSADYQDWWNVVAGRYPQLRREAPLATLKALPRDALPRHVAVWCADACADGSLAAHVYARIAGSQWHPEGQEVLLLLVETRRLLAARHSPPGGVDFWVRELLAQFTGQGMAFEPDLRAHLAAHALHEIDFHLRLLTSAADRPEGRLLGAEVREKLKEVARRIKGLTGGHNWWGFG
ncbi:hypothetical protein [Nonomuraea sp. NPDC049625]|uniref:hypothetical protein n=1 Tax=Nonomuraea sp. NPDC049625 TaxID=3155775 RepID=UPI00341D4BEF